MPPFISSVTLSEKPITSHGTSDIAFLISDFPDKQICLNVLPIAKQRFTSARGSQQIRFHAKIDNFVGKFNLDLHAKVHGAEFPASRQPPISCLFV
jgi:hypothetical protein